MYNSLSNLLKSITENSESSDLLNDRYQVNNLIGQGAMGQVYSALDKKAGDLKVAIKFLSKTVFQETMRICFEREAQISTLLGEQSNHIVKVRDYGLDKNKNPFYVMEFLQGNSLEQLIKTKTLSLGKFLSLSRQICLGLECAHQGIVVDGKLFPVIHRDLKPSNIFLARQPDSKHSVKILDFGIAQIANPRQSQVQSFMGTVEYSSPEQMEGGEIDTRSDIYSLGVLMYEMLTGEKPIKADRDNFPSWHEAHHKNPPKKLPNYLELPPELEKIIMACLAKSPERRPQEVGEILQVINSLEREYVRNNIVTKIASDSSSKKLLDIHLIYDRVRWPADKPQQKIVFPAVNESREGNVASLWTMVGSEELSKFSSNPSICHSHFLFHNSSHPMILWLNLLYVSPNQYKWLNCYLDMKTELANKIVTSLVTQKNYHILLFSLGKPWQVEQIISSKISEQKARQLRSFLLKSCCWQGKRDPFSTKEILKKQLKPVKTKILEAVAKVKGY